MKTLAMLTMAVVLLVGCSGKSESKSIKSGQLLTSKKTVSKTQDKPKSMIFGAHFGQRGAIETIRRLRGRFKFQDDRDWAMPIDDATDLPVVVVDVFGKDATDSDVEQLKELTELRNLNLSSTRNTDAGLEHLKAMAELQHLYLQNKQGSQRVEITDDGLVHLKGLTKLKTLMLDGNVGVTDAGLLHLHGLSNLRSLNVPRTQVTDVGIANLKAALPKCRIGR